MIRMEFFYNFVLLGIYFHLFNLFGGLIKYHYEGGQKYQKIQNLALHLSIPMNINKIIDQNFSI